MRDPNEPIYNSNRNSYLSSLNRDTSTWSDDNEAAQAYLSFIQGKLNRSDFNFFGNPSSSWKQREENLYNAALARQQALNDAALARQQSLEDASRVRQQSLEDVASDRAYNDPSAERARMEAAGINYDLYLASGGNLSHSTAVPEAPTSEAFAPDSVLPESTNVNIDRENFLNSLNGISSLLGSCINIASGVSGILNNIINRQSLLKGIEEMQSRINLNNIQVLKAKADADYVSTQEEALKFGLSRDKLDFFGKGLSSFFSRNATVLSNLSSDDLAGLDISMLNPEVEFGENSNMIDYLKSNFSQLYNRDSSQTDINSGLTTALVSSREYYDAVARVGGSDRVSGGIVSDPSYIQDFADREARFNVGYQSFKLADLALKNEYTQYMREYYQANSTLFPDDFDLSTSTPLEIEAYLKQQQNKYSVKYVSNLNPKALADVDNAIVGNDQLLASAESERLNFEKAQAEQAYSFLNDHLKYLSDKARKTKSKTKRMEILYEMQYAYMKYTEGLSKEHLANDRAQAYIQGICTLLGVSVGTAAGIYTSRRKPYNSTSTTVSSPNYSTTTVTYQ